MPTIDKSMHGGIEKTYFGPTLYVKTNRGNTYSCQPIGWSNMDGDDVTNEDGCTVVEVRAWPGYGTYKGKVILTPEQTKLFREVIAYKE